MADLQIVFIALSNSSFAIPKMTAAKPSTPKGVVGVCDRAANIRDAESVVTTRIHAEVIEHVALVKAAAGDATGHRSQMVWTRSASCKKTIVSSAGRPSGGAYRLLEFTP